MPRLDLTLPELHEYHPVVAEPGDFDDFWRETLAESRALGAPATVVPYESPLTGVDVFDVTFPGFGGHPIKAWLLLPADRSEPLPVIVQYVGYGGGRGQVRGTVGGGVEREDHHQHRCRLGHRHQRQLHPVDRCCGDGEPSVD